MKKFDVWLFCAAQICRMAGLAKSPAVMMFAGVSLLGACATPNASAPKLADDAAGVKWQSALADEANASGGAAKPVSVQWQHRTFPGKKAGRYQVVSADGRSVIASESNASASMLRQTVRVEAAQLSSVKFSWKVPALIAGADLADSERSDSPVRVVLAFDGDRSKFSAKDAMMAELALTLTGEPMPYAMLMYVWNGQGATGDVIKTARTDRIRKLVVEAGPERLGQWLEYERDVKADFVKAFGEEPGALVGVGIMSDTDNTRGQARAWFGPVSLSTQAPGNLVGKATAGNAPAGGMAAAVPIAPAGNPQ